MARVSLYFWSGFIGLDCGLPANSSYTEPITGINYISDATFIDTGVSMSISPVYKTNSLEQEYNYVRSFSSRNQKLLHNKSYKWHQILDPREFLVCEL